MRISKLFNRCPNCGVLDISFDGMKKLYCQECSFTYFHNAAAAVAAVLEYGEQVVFIKRN